MNMWNRKYRLTLVTSLVVGTAMVGFAPYHAASINCPLAAQSTGVSPNCCCGVTGDCRCGTACCQTPTPKQDRAPAPPKPTDESNLVLGLAHASNSAVDSPAAVARWQFLGAGRPLSAADSSLLALSVRLNF